jgi:hypothetical protein
MVNVSPGKEGTYVVIEGPMTHLSSGIRESQFDETGIGAGICSTRSAELERIKEYYQRLFGAPSSL